MIPFSLEKYLENPARQVVTRDGRPARIICTNAKCKYHVIALVESDGMEITYNYNAEGKYLDGDEDNRDLFFVSEKKTCWVNVYMEKDGTHIRVGGVYDTKEEAIEHMSIHEYAGTVSFDLEF